ncbi:hypothetical protein ACF3NT_12095 [Naumannella halotolerans]
MIGVWILAGGLIVYSIFMFGSAAYDRRTAGRTSPGTAQSTTEESEQT